MVILKSEVQEEYDGVELALPEVIRIEPSSVCNLRCIHCPTGIHSDDQKRRGIMSQETFDIVLREIKEINPNEVILFHGGEPFLNKNIFHMIQQIKSLGINFVRTSSNGMLFGGEMLTKAIQSGLDGIDFSLDGDSAEENNRIRVGSDFQTVVSIIEKLIHMKRKLNSHTPEISISICQFPTKQDLELRRGPRIPKHIEDYFSGYNTSEIQFKLFWSVAWIGLPSDTSDYYLNKPVSEDYLSNHCDQTHKQITIRHNGDVVACYYDTTSQYVLGNIHDSTVREIWNNDRYLKLRRDIRYNECHDHCQNCHVLHTSKYIVRKE